MKSKAAMPLSCLAWVIQRIMMDRVVHEKCNVLCPVSAEAIFLWTGRDA